jgi:hypothetical protein
MEQRPWFCCWQVWFCLVLLTGWWILEKIVGLPLKLFAPIASLFR